MIKLKAKVNKYYKKIEHLKSEIEKLHLVLDNAIEECDKLVINQTCVEISCAINNISKEIEALEFLLPEILDAKIKPEEKENLLNKVNEVLQSVNLTPTSQALLKARNIVPDKSTYIAIDTKEAIRKRERKLDSIANAQGELDACHRSISHLAESINLARNSKNAKEFTSKAYPIIY